MIRVAIYSRKSVLTDKGESIENQIKIIKTYFNGKNVNFEIFEDEGFSGKNTNRPSFNRMMRMVEMKKFDIVAVYKLDRIARNVIDFIKIYEKFEKNEVKFLSVTEQFDTSTPLGRMMMYIIANFAEIERENLRGRVIDNKKELAKLGQWSGGTSPVGYKAIKEEHSGKKVPYLQVDESKKHIPLYAFKWLLEGYSLERISRKLLDDLNYKLSRVNVKRLLTNPVYTEYNELTIGYFSSLGIQIFNNVNGSGLIRNSFKDEIIIATSKHTPLITAEDFIKAQILIKEISIEPKPRISSKTFLAQSVYCGYCDSSYRIDVIHGQNVVRKQCKCGRNIPVDKLENLVLNYLSSVVNGDIEIGNIDNTSLLNKKKTIQRKIESQTAVLNGLIEKLALIPTNVSGIIIDKINSTNIEVENLKNELIDIDIKINDSLKMTNIITVQSLWEKFNRCTSIDDKQRVFKMMIDKVLWFPKPNSRKDGMIKVIF